MFLFDVEILGGGQKTIPVTLIFDATQKITALKFNNDTYTSYGTTKSGLYIFKNGDKTIRAVIENNKLKLSPKTPKN